MMKKLTALFAAAIMILGLSSCDSKQRLAEQLQGTWTMQPDQITDTEGQTIGIMRLVEFVKEPSQAGGEIVISSMVSVNTQLPDNDNPEAPVSVTASGKATISGTWAAVDDDEIAIYLRPETFSVEVDPSATVLTPAGEMSENGPDLAKLQPSAAQYVRQQITESLRGDFFKFTKIDDIKIQGNIMTCEVNHRDITLRTTKD
ncbi:MAG: DUF5052 family protein [Muribaculaceae bacterium]|nr:DUF5052 family protein [Muribaculaceae bacterium]